MASVHFRLTAFGAAPTPDPAVGWERLRPLLRDRAATRLRRRQRQARRAVAAIAAAAVFTASISFAAVPIGRLVAHSVEGIVHLIRGGDAPESAAPQAGGRANGAGNVPSLEPQDEDVRPPRNTGASGGNSKPTESTEEETAGVIVPPLNQRPTAEDDDVTTDEDTPITVEVLANDVFSDGDALTVMAAQPTDGSVEAEDDGTVTYTPARDFADTDSFTYTVTGGSAVPSEATVTVKVRPVNDPPLPEDDAFATDEDTPITIDVLANDVDVDDDKLALNAQQPEHGSVEVGQHGTATYTPSPNFAGTDSFTYSVSDKTADPVEAIVTIEVRPVNDSPVAEDDQAVTHDTPVPIPVLVNDYDPDGDPLTVAANQPGGGSAIVTADGTIMYTPMMGFTGIDSFVYTVSDGISAPVEAHVTVIVTPGPEHANINP